MKKNNTCILLLLLSTLPLIVTAQSNDWRLIWSDEFNTEGRLSPSVWNYEQGYVRNEEAQWYQPDNAVCKGAFLSSKPGRNKVAGILFMCVVVTIGAKNWSL